MKGKLVPTLASLLIASLMMQPTVSLARSLIQGVDYTPALGSLSYFQKFFGSSETDAIIVNEGLYFAVTQPQTVLGIGQPLFATTGWTNDYDSIPGENGNSVKGPNLQVSIHNGGGGGISVSGASTYDPRPYMTSYDYQFPHTNGTIIDRPWGAAEMPGPSIALINVVSAGTSGYYHVPDWIPRVYDGGAGGDISLTSDVKLTLSVSELIGGSGLPWQPKASLIYATSQAGASTGFENKGAAGGNVDLVFTNTLHLSRASDLFIDSPGV